MGRIEEHTETPCRTKPPLALPPSIEKVMWCQKTRSKSITRVLRQQRGPGGAGHRRSTLQRRVLLTLRWRNRRSLRAPLTTCTRWRAVRGARCPAPSRRPGRTQAECPAHSTPHPRQPCPAVLQISSTQHGAGLEALPEGNAAYQRLP